ncbi:Uncharacterized protein PECH_002451 [Penicillium ucsense]|uniref:Major facilitator superfamily (MFS) profile domain-containing protein n=1 Tax=Penicillium ucsense TaxID=2839758 RepID=A0A8J8WL04_9EURO|nr:Uncharacterized protein PECM_003080 [Penicillium ucsense]KAF7737985.1 Uncharacterized protein PECH_002451 [Penicillium ucsense]
MADDGQHQESAIVENFVDKESTLAEEVPIVSAPDIHDVTLHWDQHPQNPLNLPARKRSILMIMVSLAAFITSAATSVVTPAQSAIQKAFNVSFTQSLLPLSLYTFALGSGPVIGGPVSETVGRMPVYYVAFPLGALFTLGAGLTSNFAALCFLRTAAGFCWAPMLTVAAGSIAETFSAKARGGMMALYILMPFLGPGFGPIFGAYAVSRHDWRWTQWVILFMTIPCLILIAFTPETFPPVLKRRIASRESDYDIPKSTLLANTHQFVTVTLSRPVHMLFTEPIVSFICLYTAINFGVLFCYFAAVPYMVEKVYSFSTEQAGLVFFSIVIGSTLGFITLVLCDIFFYRPKLRNLPPGQGSPEHRLYPAMIGSIGLPLGLFWFAWTSKSSISWASPVAAIVPYAWGNLCVFVSTAQYALETYHGNVLASVASAMSLARYVTAGAFPLFIMNMYKALHLDWAISLFGFVAVALVPIPFVLFKFGPRIRAKSKYETL